jgi:hypothetical protein
MIAIEDNFSKYNHKDYFEISIEAWKKYCTKNSIDFILIDKKLNSIPHSKWTKHFLFDYIEDKYEKIGMVDFDTIPKWDMPNPFELYNDEFCGVIDNCNLNWLNNSLNAYKSTFQELDVDIKISEYINSGVLFFTKNHKFVFEEMKHFYFNNKTVLDNWSVSNTGRDQTILNLVLKKLNIKKKYFPYSWNTVSMIKKGMFFYNDKLQDFTPFFIKYGNIWHFTGFSIEERTNIIRQLWSQTKHLY